MARHSRRHSSSRSRSRSRGSRRHHSRSRSYDRSHRHHRHRSYSRDRSDSYDRHSSRRDRSRDRHHKSHSHHSPDRSVSKSPVPGNQKEPIESKNEMQNNSESKPSVIPGNAKSSSSEFLLPVKTATGPKRIFRFDDRGREINEFGEVIETPIIKPVATLSINKKQQQKNQINPYLSTFTPGKGTKAAPKIKNRLIVDSRIKIANREVRRHKALKFVKEGSIVKFAEEVRKKAARALVSQATLTEAQAQDDPAGQAGQPASEAKEVASPTTPIQDPSALPPPNHYTVPDMEWWDYDFLPADICKEVKANQYLGELSYDMLQMEHCITREVIEHPVPVERNKLPPPKPLPLMLTKAERKKERRKNRAEREEEKRIRIQAGLLPKPEQKLTYRNYKQVLGTEALAKPTWADNLVKEQIEKRKMAHQQRNEERKLTPQEASEKKQRKVIGDKNGELEGCLFRIESLSDKKQRFKVNVNAQQYHLVGRCLIVPSCKCVMVYVEGTKKAMRHFVKLMTHRIQWNQRVDTENQQENDDTIPNSCTLLWQGMIKVCRFKEFMMMDCDSDLDARREMEEKSLVQHWDSVINYVPEISRI